MTITTTTTRETSGNYDTFTFDDGATVRSSGGLICSEHGHRHCRHHKLAHTAITAKAASQEAATAMPASPAICWECGDVLRKDITGHYCDWCAPIMDFLKTNAFKPANPEPEPQVADFPLLMNVEAEVAIVIAEMEADDFTWSEAAQTWVRKLGILVEQEREDAERAARFAPKTLAEVAR